MSGEALSVYSICYGLDGQGMNSSVGKTFLFSEMFTASLGLTKRSVQRVQVPFSREQSGRNAKLLTSI